MAWPILTLALALAMQSVSYLLVVCHLRNSLSPSITCATPIMTVRAHKIPAVLPTHAGLTVIPLEPTHVPLNPSGSQRAAVAHRRLTLLLPPALHALSLIGIVNSMSLVANQALRLAVPTNAEMFPVDLVSPSGCAKYSCTSMTLWTTKTTCSSNHADSIEYNPVLRREGVLHEIETFSLCCPLHYLFPSLFIAVVHGPVSATHPSPFGTVHNASLLHHILNLHTPLLPEIYLTKMCNQDVALISPEHAESIIWNEHNSDNELSESDQDESDRMFSFEVANMNEQEELVSVRKGFKAELRIGKTIPW
ncbi:hypothetical protein BU15DRAFT_67234 [Melanogaster broomeanus]|nr:hypothetical protein BU15DRAFT_67234 [Melanogaster broomeanus]